MRTPLAVSLMLAFVAGCYTSPILIPDDSGGGGTSGGGTSGTAATGGPCRAAGGTAGVGVLGHVPEPQSCDPSGIIDSNGNGDQCLGDTDCAKGTFCRCGSDAAGAFSRGPNVCVASGCRVDSDCASGLCAPSPGSGCGPTITGRFCRTSRDTCRGDFDCTSCAHPDSPLLDTCQYVREAGHWQCATRLFCSG